MKHTSLSFSLPIAVLIHHSESIHAVNDVNLFSSNKISKSFLTSRNKRDTKYRWEIECVEDTCENYEEYLEGAENHFGKYILREGKSHETYKKFYLENYEPSDSSKTRRTVLKKLSNLIKTGHTSDQSNKKYENFCSKYYGCRLRWKNQCGEMDYNSTNWMKILNDTAVVSDISLPGTHDSYALSDSVKSYAETVLAGIRKEMVNSEVITKYSTVGQSLIICQTLKVEQQVNMGIRVLDARMIIDENGSKHKKCKQRPITFSHHNVIQDGNLITEITKLLSFLENNPSEFVIVKYKLEFGDITVSDIKHTVKCVCEGYCRNSQNCDEKCVFEEEKNSGNWLTSQVKDLRGKLIFWPKSEDIASTKSNLQKTSAGKYLGFGVGGETKFQRNVYKYFEESWNTIEIRSDKSLTRNPFMLYLSGNGMHKRYGPLCIATGENCGGESNSLDGFGLNNMLVDKLEKGIQRYNLGIVMIDFPGAYLVNKIVKQNC